MGTLLLLALIARIGAGTLVSFVPPDTVPAVSLDPRHLPY
jgi:NitT/TauT family transport system permease protein